jgi:putative ABC transport system permease protein
MLRNYLKTALKNIFRRKSNTWINILGLSLGLSITMLIWMHVLYERSYDRFFNDYNRVFRVQNTMDIWGEESITIPTTMFAVAEWVLDQVPEVEQATRFTNFLPNAVLRIGDQIIHTPMIAGADSTFFDLFNFNFLAGNPDKALAEHGSLVLTYSLAEKLFEAPLLAMDQLVQVYDNTYKVTAIIEDVPENSHMAFNGLISMLNIPDAMKIAGFGFFTYFRLRPNARISELEERLSAISEQVGLTNPYYQGETMPFDTRLVNLADIHLTSNLIWEMKPNGSLRNVQIFTAMSIFILILALINYINMATARSSLRAKEIGLRKVAGSSRAGLIRQFMVESFVVTLMAFLLALILAENFSGFFSQRLGIDINSGILFTPRGLITLIAMLIITGTLAGVYPAFYLSSFNPVSILKGEMVKGNKGQFFRRALVVFQFAITIFLVSSLLVIAMQLNFMLKQSLGYEKESVMIARDVSIPIRRALPQVVAQLEAIEGVNGVSPASFIIGETNHIEVVSEYGNSNSPVVKADILMIDDKFIPLMEMRLVEGRNFYADSELDAQGAYILNQAAVSALGLENPLKSRLSFTDKPGPIVGVVENFQFKSLHNPIEPIVFMYARRNHQTFYMKLGTQDMQKIRAEVSAVFNDFDPTWFPNLQMLNDRLEGLYSRERQSTNLLTAGSLLAFIISLLGVYGLANFAIERRLREIGIRKVLGSSVRSLVWVFNKEFSLLVLIAFVIAAPLAWWVMDGWLSHFVLRVYFNPLWLILPALIILFFNAAIISTQVWKAAKANPVDVLKTE